MGPFQKLISVAAALCILFYFLVLAGEGVHAYFSPDDLMNLYGYWQRPLGDLVRANLLFYSNFFRPMGGVFYRLVYALAGFHPLPFRVACYFLLLFNLYLTYSLARRLSGSREVGLLATLLSAYHARFVDLYYSTGTVYDLLCFTFLYGAFLFYVRIRQSGRDLRIWEWIVCCGLYICALNSKEMAVTLPLFIGAYEWIYHGIGKPMRVAAALVVITLVFVIGKTTGPERITSNPEYHPAVSVTRYLEAFQTYTGKLFYHETWFNVKKGVSLLLLLMLTAWISEAPQLRLGFVILTLGILPVAFITPRGGFVLYMPMVGWSLFGATLLVRAREAVLRRPPSLFAQSFLFVMVTAGLGWIHRSHYESTWLTSPKDKLKVTVDGMRRLQPQVTHGAKVLFLNDLFEIDENWQLKGLLQLTYDDHDLQVESLKRMNPQPDAQQQANFDYVFQFIERGVIQVKPKS